VVRTLETTVGRPRKYGDEKTEPVTARVPLSVRDYLRGDGRSASGPAADALIFEKELTEALKSVHSELLISAAHQGQEYSQDRAETLARLVRLGLKNEKKR
jgi:hypothetical protein